MVFFVCGIANANNSSIRITLNTPQITFRNVSIGENVFGNIEAINKNNFDVNVTLIPNEKLCIIFYENITEKVLLPNETWNANYTVLIKQSGTWNSYISIKYVSNESSIPVSLQQKLFFIGAEEKTFKLRSYVLVPIILSLICIILCLRRILELKRREKEIDKDTKERSTL